MEKVADHHVSYGKTTILEMQIPLQWMEEEIAPVENAGSFIPPFVGLKNQSFWWFIGFCNTIPMFGQSHLVLQI